MIVKTVKKWTQNRRGYEHERGCFVQTSTQERAEILEEARIIERRTDARAGFNAMYRSHGFQAAYAKFRADMNLKTPMEIRLKTLRREIRYFRYAKNPARPKEAAEVELAALVKEARRRARIRTKLKKQKPKSRNNVIDLMQAMKKTLAERAQKPQEKAAVGTFLGFFDK